MADYTIRLINFMKIHLLKLDKKYRSLEPFNFKFLKHPLLNGKLDPMCLVGLNGSGKSNFLELLADIFFEIERFFLEDNKLYKEDSPKYFAYANNKTKEDIFFEIQYTIGEIIKDGKMQNPGKKIRIRRNEKETKKKLEFAIEKETIQSHGYELFQSNNFVAEENFEILSIDTIEKCKEIRNKYLPQVIAYTSGLNDLLTLPFIDLQDYYAQQVAREALNKQESLEEIPTPNLLLLNYETNASIVVSNILANQDQLKVFQENLRIQRVNSFRIVIRLNKLHGNKEVQITEELKKYIDWLCDCSSLINRIISEKGNEYILDFIIRTA